jgi:ABC-type multidrug transport system permease subunit
VIGRIFALFIARNIEFVRDRASMAWAILMPFGLVLGMGFVFSGDDTNQFTVGVLGDDVNYTAERHAFFTTRYVEFVAQQDAGLALAKIGRHELDMLLQTGASTRYWINPDSPAGYVIERLLLQSDATAIREEVTGDAVRYVDWVVPGILGMNMMFSSLFGVGYVVVRYRKNGFLKRLQATPLRAFEFITAQALSRLILTLTVQGGVFLAVLALLDIRMNGSYLALLAIGVLGCSSLISLALILAARVSSEELAGGLVNLIAFPMVLLSGVFYSLEGSPQILQQIAGMLPLTQMLDGARAIMIDGAGMVDVLPQIIFLAATTVLFLVVGSALFRWRFA